MSIGQVLKSIMWSSLFRTLSYCLCYWPVRDMESGILVMRLTFGWRCIRLARTKISTISRRWTFLAFLCAFWPRIPAEWELTRNNIKHDTLVPNCRLFTNGERMQRNDESQLVMKLLLHRSQIKSSLCACSFGLSLWLAYAVICQRFVVASDKLISLAEHKVFQEPVVSRLRTTA